MTPEDALTVLDARKIDPFESEAWSREWEAREVLRSAVCQLAILRERPMNEARAGLLVAQQLAAVVNGYLAKPPVNTAAHLREMLTRFDRWERETRWSGS